MAQQDEDQQHNVQKHVGADDSFLVIKGVVYDAANFLNLHSLEAGKDAIQTFELVHSRDALSKLPTGTQLSLTDLPTEKTPAANEVQWQRARELVPPAKRMILLQDFEFWAQKTFIANKDTAYERNMEVLRRYFFRPRMLRDMSNGSIRTSFLRITSELPVYIAPAAMAKLSHPLGEVNLTKAAGFCGVVQSVSTNANCSLEEIFEATKESQTLSYQVYIDKAREVTAEILQKVERLGMKAIIFTIDVGWESKRTLENRTNKPSSKEYLGAFMAMGELQDRRMSWDDISWIRRYTKLPIIIKSAQCIKDVELCVKHGAEGVMISNHGGRQVDYAPAPINILYELRTYRPDLFSQIDIMIDGGVRSGADVVKLLALGAKAVGFGRTFLYANATHGEEGIRRVIEILREEIVNTMWNIGATTISDLKPEMVGPSGPWVGVNRPSYVAKY